MVRKLLAFTLLPAPIFGATLARARPEAKQALSSPGTVLFGWPKR